DKLQEIDFMPITEVRVPWHDGQYMRYESECSPIEDHQSATRSSSNITQGQLACSQASGHDRFDEFGMQSHVSRDANDQMFTSESLRSLYIEQMQLGYHESETVEHSEGGTFMVVRGDDKIQRSPIQASNDRDNH